MKVTQYIGGRRGLHSRPLGSWSKIPSPAPVWLPPTPLYPSLKPPASLQASVQLGICTAAKCSGQSVPVVQRQGGPLGVMC